MRRIPPKNAFQKRYTTTAAKKFTRLYGARICQSTDTNYPSAYHTQKVDQFCRSKQATTTVPLPTVAVIAAAVPKSIKTGNYWPRNSGSVHPFFHTHLRTLVSPQVRFFVVFSYTLGGTLSSADPTDAERCVGWRLGTISWRLTVPPASQRFCTARAGRTSLVSAFHTKNFLSHFRGHSIRY